MTCQRVKSNVKDKQKKGKMIYHYFEEVFEILKWLQLPHKHQWHEKHYREVMDTSHIQFAHSKQRPD